MEDRIVYRGVTFDDVLLEPGYSELMPSEVDTSSQLTRHIRLNVPMLSSPMDTVTESDMAVAMAQEGGIGIIHKNMSIENQSLEVERVKRAENGVIVDPQVGLGGAEGRPRRIAQAEAALNGKAPSVQAFAAAAEEAAAAIDPLEDLQANAKYRRDLVRTVIRRALERAAA